MILNTLRNNNILLFITLGFFIVGFLFYSEANGRANLLVKENQDNLNTAARVSAVAAFSDDPLLLAQATVEPAVEETEEVIVESVVIVEPETEVVVAEPTPTPVVVEEEIVPEIEELIEEVEVIEGQEEVVEETPTIELPYYRTIFGEESGWVLGFGAMNFKDENLLVGGGPFDAANLALLENSNQLTDYKAEVTFDWNKGGSVSLVARFADYGNYAICQYQTNASQVSIVHVRDGERRSEGSSPGLGTKSFDAWKDLNIGIEANGNTISCLKDGNVVLKSTLKKLPEAGGFGISNWGRQGGDALSTIDEVRITAN